MAKSESYYTAGQVALIRRRFFRKPAAVLAGILLLLLVLMGFFSGFVSPHEPTSRGADRAYINGPPQIPTLFDDGAFRPWICGTSQEMDLATLTRVVVEDCSQKRHLAFFVEGWTWTVVDLGFGLKLESDLHLFGMEDGGHIHLFGTDGGGKDLFGRTIEAIWVTLSLGFLGLVIKLFMSLLVGGVAGFVGGRTDAILMTITDAVRAVPNIPIFLALAVAMPQTWSAETRYFAIATMLGVFDFPTLGRRLRSHILAERNQDYVLAARLSGASSGRIIWRHLIPSFGSYIIVDTLINFPYMILAETSLSFIGVGLTEPINSIGVLLQAAQDVEVMQNYLWYYIPVGFFVTMILAFVLVGDGMRDAADPYSEANR